MKTLLTLLALLSQPALAQDLLGDAIYNGKPVAADGQAWKSTVSLTFQNTAGTYSGCSGVFVAQDMILTAAHCRMKNGGSVTISLYKENSTEPTQIFLEGDEFAYHAHPKYSKRTVYDVGTDDVAILMLKEKRLPDDFEVAELQTSSIMRASDPGRVAYVVGAGLRQSGEDSDRLYFTQGVISRYEGGSVMVVNFSGRTGVCSGDSGGPVFVKSGSTLYLSALTTATPTNLGKNCGNTLYANTITADRYNWIQKKAAAVRAGWEN